MSYAERRVREIKMSISKAIYIFENIDSTEYTDEEKGMAIYLVTKMPTHNSITKASMLNVLKWILWNFYELPGEDKN